MSDSPYEKCVSCGRKKAIRERMSVTDTSGSIPVRVCRARACRASSAGGVELPRRWRQYPAAREAVAVALLKESAKNRRRALSLIERANEEEALAQRVRDNNAPFTEEP